MLPPNTCRTDELWEDVRRCAADQVNRDPHMRAMLEDIVLNRSTLGSAVNAILCRRLAGTYYPRETCEHLFSRIMKEHRELSAQMAADLRAVVRRDPASRTALVPLLFFKGFHALCAYRLAHALWEDKRELAALLLQSLTAEVFGIDIHPAARIGCGIMLDHGTGIVIGETAIVENDVSLLHEVTLGGTGKELCARHPVVRSGVMIGAGAKVLGRIEIGEGAKIAASSVVLTDVRAHTTVAGVPALEVSTQAEVDTPAFNMRQSLQ